MFFFPRGQNVVFTEFLQPVLDDNLILFSVGFGDVVAGMLCPAKRRGIELIDFFFGVSICQKLRFPMPFFREGVVFVIGIAVAYN